MLAIGQQCESQSHSQRPDTGIVLRPLHGDVVTREQHLHVAALRIFAAFAWGLKRWEDGQVERSRLAANVQSNGSGVNGMNGTSSVAGVDEGHAILERLVEGLKQEDVLLERILRECLKIGNEE